MFIVFVEFIGYVVFEHKNYNKLKKLNELKKGIEKWWIMNQE